MGINVVIDETLVAEAKRLTGLASDSAAIEEVLRRAATRSRPLDGMLELSGTNPLRDDYDHKALRRGDGNDERR